MALLENLDQRETLSQVVSNWALTSGVSRWWCSCNDVPVGTYNAHPRNKEEGCLKVALGHFRTDGGCHCGDNNTLPDLCYYLHLTTHSSYRGGEVGAPGMQGSTGARGPTGPKGERGAPGECGALETQWQQVSSGKSWDRAESSSPVPAMPIAAEGKHAKKWAQGSPSSSFTPGSIGATGPQGSPGARGPPGLKGDKGVPGDKGAKGENGLLDVTSLRQQVEALQGQIQHLQAAFSQYKKESLSCLPVLVPLINKGLPDTGCASYLWGPGMGVPGDTAAHPNAAENPVQTLSDNPTFPTVVRGDSGLTAGCFLYSQKLAWSIPSSTWEKSLIELFPNGQSVGEKIFKTTGVVKPFAEAQLVCTQFGGQLASPRSAAENAALQQLVIAQNEAAFLSMTDSKTEGKFTYPTGEPLVYSNWAPGEPNNDGGSEDCVEIFANGKWNDRACGEKRLVVCKF
ncbi:hypothetical protein P7K49_023525 [Saguinus oedipus]|uniref:C-type lectin domain-containing protein n=1 Tax=Saguinus oedipus TaxID=9490 RepID=A0ABQ9ULZ0_SAGOE|nr:hypothetical protein P7K49_023525 [Saguinus oedipus]